MPNLLVRPFPVVLQDVVLQCTRSFDEPLCDGLVRMTGVLLVSFQNLL